MKIRKYLSFLYGLGMGIGVNVIGRLLFAEILAILRMPFVNYQSTFKKIPQLRPILIALIVLLFSQILSDWINYSSSEDYLRGWALIVFSGISIIFLTHVFLDGEKSILLFLVGVIVTSLIFGEGELDPGLQNENTNYFKSRLMGFTNAAVLILSLLLMRIRKRNSVILVFILYGLLCLFLDARSNALAFIISSILIAIKFWKIRLTARKVILLGFLATTVSLGLYRVYVNQVLYNDFGGKNALSQLNRTNDPYNPFELLFYGRTDFFVLIEAIKEKPIVGHGSWGKDPNLRYARLMQKYSGAETVKELGYIKAHSVVLGFWSYSGLVGLISIVFCYLLLTKTFIKFFNSRIILNIFPIALFAYIEGIWHFLFSPIQVLRVSLPFLIAVLLVSRFKQKLILQNIV